MVTFQAQRQIRNSLALILLICSVPALSKAVGLPPGSYVISGNVFFEVCSLPPRCTIVGTTSISGVLTWTDNPMAPVHPGLPQPASAFFVGTRITVDGTGGPRTFTENQIYSDFRDTFPPGDPSIGISGGLLNSIIFGHGVILDPDVVLGPSGLGGLHRLVLAFDGFGVGGNALPLVFDGVDDWYWSLDDSDQFAAGTLTARPVPEPSSLVLLILGAMAIALSRSRVKVGNRG